MGKIIQKDFFPDLEKLKAQNDYLDAVGRNDFVKVKQLQAKYSGRTPLLNPRGLGGKLTFIAKSQINVEMILIIFYCQEKAPLHLKRHKSTLLTQTQRR